MLPIYFSSSSYKRKSTNLSFYLMPHIFYDLWMLVYLNVWQGIALMTFIHELQCNHYISSDSRVISFLYVKRPPRKHLAVQLFILLERSVGYGASGASENRGPPAQFPTPPRRTAWGGACYFMVPCPCPRPRPFTRKVPVKKGGEKGGPIQGMSGNSPPTVAGRGSPTK